MAGKAIRAGKGERGHEQLAGVILPALLVVVLTVTSLARNAVWRDDIGLWRDAAAKIPGSDRS
jgi:hypothetical protein